MYEKRVVLFLDILGFSNLVSKGEEEIVLAALKHIKSRSGSIEHMLSAKGTRFTSFSDCIVISHPVENNQPGCVTVTLLACQLAQELLDKGVLTRGGITVGNVQHDESILFGPALIDAYKLESKQAFYPRILVSKEARDLAKVEQTIMQDIDGLSDKDVVHSPHLFRRDFDGLWHVDILCPTTLRPRRSSTANSDEHTSRACANSVLPLCKPDHDPSVAPKYDWLFNYFNETCVKNGWPTHWTLSPNNTWIARDEVDDD